MTVPAHVSLLAQAGYFYREVPAYHFNPATRRAIPDRWAGRVDESALRTLVEREEISPGWTVFYDGQPTLQLSRNVEVVIRERPGQGDITWAPVPSS